MQKGIIPQEIIERRIFLIRRQKVMLDIDLAKLYEVSTKVFNQAVKRNKSRFPLDFMFQLTLTEALKMRSQFVIASKKEEFANLRSQIVTSSWGGRRYRPYVFTEQGVAMLSSVLRSERAIRVNIEIMRVFVRLRKIVAMHKNLARRLNELEKKCDAQFKIVFDAIRELITQPEPPRKQIGFHAKDRRGRYVAHLQKRRQKKLQTV